MAISFSRQQVNKLIIDSMLYQAKQNIAKYQSKSWFGHHSYSTPEFKQILESHSVWLDFYPLSTLTTESQSVLDVYGNAKLLALLANIGINVIHTNPMQAAGGIDSSLHKYPSTDGGYDRISYDIEPQFGTNQQYRTLVENASQNHICIAGDVIPGHTGFGSDFILALLNYAEYPSLYIMREIEPCDWNLLPQTQSQTGTILSYNVNPELHEKLRAKNYIPGDMSLIMFHEPGIKDTNWSVTQEIVGYDGVTRRWLYLHWFKQGQPTLDWLSPSFAAHQLLAGDILHHRYNLGTKFLRFDANCLLGLEKLQDSTELLGAGHPLSVLITNQLAMLMRRLGGLSYEENNAELDNIKHAESNGPDLSYDFAMRTGYIHAIATGDVGLLYLQQELVNEYQINTQRLIHAMQNHDNLCYELVHFDKYPEQHFLFRGKQYTGRKIKNVILCEVQEFCRLNNLPFKLSFGGIQAHFIELCAARFGISKERILDNNCSIEEKNNIKQLMLLAVFYNAMQPGVIQLSAWDLVGAISKPNHNLNNLLKDGDLRWYCRSGFKLLDGIEVDKSAQVMPECFSFFGSIQTQVEDEASFINKLKSILDLREQIQISTFFNLDNIVSTKQGLLINIYSSHNVRNKYNSDNKSVITLYLVVLNFSENLYNYQEEIKEYLINTSVCKIYNQFNIDQDGEYLIQKYSGKIIEVEISDLGQFISKRTLNASSTAII